MAVLNWSERPEPNASGLRDCTYAAGLTGMVYAGFTAFAKGIYSVAEREALERSDDQKDETGASLVDLKVAIKRRYGKDVTIHAASALSDLLDRVEAIGYVIQGKTGNFPVGHTLRRWDPGFTGGHAVFVQLLGGGKYRWFDPEAPMKFSGDIVTKAQVLTYAKGLGGSIHFRADEFAPPVVKPPVVVPPPAPTTYTKAEYDAVVAERDTVRHDLQVSSVALAATKGAQAAAEARIAAAKTALG